MAKNKRLKDSERRLIVTMLSTWHGTGEIVEALGRDVPRKTIQSYDAGNARNRGKLAGKWIRLFDDTRESFLQDTRDVAISHRAFRLRELDALYRKMRAAEDADRQVSILQAAKAESPDRAEDVFPFPISYQILEIDPEAEQLFTAEGTPVFLSEE